MKDQKALLIKCITNDIPAVVISAKDVNSVPTLLEYLEQAKKNGCSSEFISDFSQVINGFLSFQKDEPKKIEIPNL
jgi:hypothetical protein